MQKSMTTDTEGGRSLACGPMGRRVDVEQLVGASDIAQRLGMPRTQDVHTLRRRDPTFPEPVRILGSGPSRGIHVWYWPDISAWARKKGITPGPASTRKRPSPSARAKEAELVRIRAELAELAELRESLGELSQLRERLDALEAGREGDDSTPAAGSH